MSEFKKNVVSGIGWSFVNQVAVQALNLLITLVLVRYITPGQFGTLGMVTVLTGFAYAFLNFGFASALVQKKEVSEKDRSTIFVLSLASGLFLYVLFFVSAGAIASFYGKPELRTLIRFVALNFLMLSLGIVQSSMLTRALNFKRLALINITSIVVAGISAIVVAVQGGGVWSLVVQSLVLSGLNAVLFFFFSGVRVQFGFDRSAFRSMFSFGGNAAADSMLSYWARNLDNLLIAKFLGDVSLGLYAKAYAVMLLPLVNFSQVISKVLFPSFSSIQQDRKKIKRVYLKVTRIIAFVTFPAMVILWALAENFVHVFFGANWVDMIPILQVLCWLGIPQSILTLNGSIYLALGRADLAFRVGLFLKLSLAIGFIVGLWQGGLIGLAIGYAIAGTINFYPSFYFAGRLVDLRFGELLTQLSRLIIATAIVGAAIFQLKQAGMFAASGMLLELLALTAIGVVIYFVILLVFRAPVLKELKAELAGLRQRKSAVRQSPT